MSLDQIITLLQNDVALIVGGAAIFLAFLGLLVGWRGVASAAKARRELAELSKSIEALEAAERRMSLALGKEASTKTATASASVERPSQPANTNGPRVTGSANGQSPSNGFSTPQGISDLSRYRKNH